jgi:hypothetical protein
MAHVALVMANTSASANNKSVTFGTKMEREMAWNNQGIVNSDSGGKNPPGVINTAPMKKRGPKTKASRKIVKSAIKRGMISEKAAKKHLGGY